MNSFLQSSFKAFWYAVKPYKVKLGFMYLLVILGNICAYSIPYFLKLIADKVAAVQGVPAWGDFLPTVSMIIVILVSEEIFFRLGHLMENLMVVRAYDRMTTALFGLLLNRPAAYFEEKFSGELTRRVEQVGNGVKFFIEYFPWEMGWPIMAAIMTAILLLLANMWLGIVFIVWLVLFLLSSYFLLRLMYRQSQIVSEKQADLSGTIVDVLSNVSVVHAFSAHEQEHSHYRSFMDDAVAVENKERSLGLWNKLHQGSSAVILNVALIITSVILFTKGSMTVGDFVIVAATLPTFTGIIWSLGEIVIRAIRQYGEMKNALEGLNTEVPSIREGDKELVVSEPTIAFQDVSFEYPGNSQKVLDGFSLVIQPGQRVGLVGKSGAGKSTVVKLLLRAYDIRSGSIQIDKKDLSAVTLDSVRKNIALVPQDTSLFHRTLYENILYAKPAASTNEVLAASAAAHAHDFIDQYPKKYDTLVGERGIKLSGGQRQRIALARAMLKNAPILVLDEATSSLDSESEEVVQKGLQELFSKRTVLAIAHRLSTLRAMDRIIVLDKGKIVEDGAPQDLLNKEGGIFRNMWEHQKKGFI